MAKFLNWQFTLNNYTEEEIANFKTFVEHDECRYVCFSREVGEEGTPHLQGWIGFKNQRVMKAVKKLIPRAHIEGLRGTMNDNETYCTKQSQLEVYGDVPLTNADRKRQAKIDWDETLRAAKEGRYEGIRADVVIRHYGTLERIRGDYFEPPANIDELDNYWFYGPTGSGKSTRVRRESTGFYLKDAASRWWNSYRGEEDVYIEDLEPSHTYIVGNLKQIADHYPFRIEIKNGMMMIRPKRVFVTSNYHPTGIFQPTQVEAIERRFKIIEII